MCLSLAFSPSLFVHNHRSSKGEGYIEYRLSKSRWRLRGLLCQSGLGLGLRQGKVRTSRCPHRFPPVRCMMITLGLEFRRSNQCYAYTLQPLTSQFPPHHGQKWPFLCTVQATEDRPQDSPRGVILQTSPRQSLHSAATEREETFV